MNTGIISSRYASALLKFVKETGNGEAVYAQVQEILKDPDSMPADLEPELSRLVDLLVRNRRLEYVRFILMSFSDMYNASLGRRLAHLTTAVPSPELERKLRSLLEEKLGGEIIFEADTDPSIIGGFILKIDDRLLDASVSRQLEEIRRQYMDKNKRIV